jgi:hypothetical protein
MRFPILFGIVASMLALAGGQAPSASAGETVTAAGTRLAQELDGFEVEKHWPAGVHVNWQTGDPDGRPEKSSGKHTHCSAFVASVAKHFGIYILRPPEHGQLLLANAQNEWLADDGAKQGWRPLKDAVEAQAAANRGELVVASYHNHHDDKPGHIAIVRPSDKSEALLKTEGPEIIQAGEKNYSETTVRIGFAGHPAAWGKNEIRYYAHAIP